jgi:hypothetical protein
MGVGALAGLTAALALVSGQWAVVSGQCVTAVALTAAARVGGAELAGSSQIELGGEPKDPEKEKAAAVARGRAHLVKTLRLDPEKVTLESATPATWPDVSLGCPEKDRMYAQVVTSGYKLIFLGDGKKHEVHVAGSRVVSCPSPRS